MKPKFKILVDEACTGLIPYLTALGWTISPSVPKGTLDEKVTVAAKQRKAVVITKDYGLTKKCHRWGIPYIHLNFPLIKEALQVHSKLLDMKAVLDFYSSEKENK